jgi:hypothetical protein
MIYPETPTTIFTHFFNNQLPSAQQETRKNTQRGQNKKQRNLDSEEHYKTRKNHYHDYRL